MENATRQILIGYNGIQLNLVMGAKSDRTTPKNRRQRQLTSDRCCVTDQYSVLTHRSVLGSVRFRVSRTFINALFLVGERSFYSEFSEENLSKIEGESILFTTR